MPYIPRRTHGLAGAAALVCLFTSGSAQAQDATAATYADIEATLGSVPGFFDAVLELAAEKARKSN